jgi:ABC-type lipoprotein export system ATPase subunit
VFFATIEQVSGESLECENPVMGSVVLENVWKVFKDKTFALRALNLVVKPGEFFVFLGPSGSRDSRVVSRDGICASVRSEL